MDKSLGVRGDIRGRDVDIPNLSRIIETYVPVSSLERTSCLRQLRQDILPHVRSLQADGHLRWFSFLLHPADLLSGHDPADKSPVIHLRLEPAADLDRQAFVELLPPHFLDPREVELSDISGVESSELRDGDWARAWRIVGEASEFVLSLLEGYQEAPSPEQTIQSLHFITSPLTLGQCLYARAWLSF